MEESTYASNFSVVWGIIGENLSDGRLPVAFLLVFKYCKYHPFK